MVKEAGQIAPAWVGAQFDHARAEHGAKKHPQDQPHHDDWRMGVRWSEKNREKTGLGEHCFPAKSVEGLADVDEREVNHPEQRPSEHRGGETERFGETA